MIEKRVMVSAKIPKPLFDEIEELKEILRIETRNELVERALLLYVSSFHHAVRAVGAQTTMR